MKERFDAIWHKLKKGPIPVSDTKTEKPVIDGKYIRFEPSYSGYKPVQKSLLSGPGAIAGEMILRWGMVAGATDTEDSAGRAKVRLQTPEELVERACVTAELFWSEATKRGWLEAVPQPFDSLAP